MITPNNSFLGTKLIDMTQTGNVAAAGDDSNIMTLPDGLLYKIKGIMAQVRNPSGASSGTHKLQILQNNEYIDYPNTRLILLSTTYDEYLYIKSYQLYGAAEEIPAAASDQFTILSNIITCSKEAGLTVRYDNDTDVTQTYDRIVVFIADVYKSVI